MSRHFIKKQHIIHHNTSIILFSVWILDAIKKIYQEWWLIGMVAEKESNESVCQPTMMMMILEQIVRADCYISNQFVNH